MDPYERADIVSDQYYDGIVKNDYLLVKDQLKAAAFLEPALNGWRRTHV